jgi:hypothetical protein
MQQQVLIGSAIFRSISAMSNCVTFKNWTPDFLSGGRQPIFAYKAKRFQLKGCYIQCSMQVLPLAASVFT